MSNYSGFELTGFGEGGKSHWGQVNCRKCDAWLKEMPDRSRKASRKQKYKLGYTGTDTLYFYYWTCLNCSFRRRVEELSPPGTYTPNPNANLHKPGTVPPPIIRDPDKWETADSLSPAQKSLVRECWEMHETLVGCHTVHEVTYLWNITGALAEYDINKVIKTAQEYVDLLDHEAIHGHRAGSYHGKEGDVTKIRKSLLEIKENDS